MTKKEMKSKFSKRIVVLVILLNAAFASAVLYVFLRTGGEPTALVTAWFAFTTGELLAMANIKNKKSKTEKTESACGADWSERV